MYRKIIFYKNYFKDFFEKQDDKIKEKIAWTLKLISEEKVISQEYFKSIKNAKGLYEIRVQFANDIFRIFCFFDKGQLVILANAYQKKSQKLSRKEIKKAIKIKKEYENEKTKSNNS